MVKMAENVIAIYSPPPTHPRHKKREVKFSKLDFSFYKYSMSAAVRACLPVNAGLQPLTGLSLLTIHHSPGFRV
jgi:hypothetical protein